MYLERHHDLVVQMEKFAHKFYSLRYQMSNGGNLSVRIPGEPLMLIKGTDVAFDEVGRDTVVVADFDGKVVEGEIKPSKESLLHGAIYRCRSEIGAIMHCHSPYATAWAAAHEQLGFSTHHSRLKLGGFVPVFDTHSYAVPKEFFPVILDSVQTHPELCAFLLRGHGQVAMAADLRAAAYLAELVEETAQIALFS